MYKIRDIKASTEEWYTYQYLLELKENGYIKEIIFQPKSFNLFEGLKRKFYSLKELKTKTVKNYTKKQYLINPHIYTPDFKVIWINNIIIDKFVQPIGNNKLNKDIPFINFLSEEGLVSYLEIKANFDRQNMTRMFTSHIQPLVWDKYNIYIQLIRPFFLFKDTFIPKSIESSFYYKTSGKWGKKGDKKYKWEYRTLNEYLKEEQNENI